MKVLSILFITIILNAEGSFNRKGNSNLKSTEMNILPYIQVLNEHGTSFGNIPGLYGFGLHGNQDIHAYNNLIGAFNGLGTTGLGYHDRFFEKQALTKGIASVGYDVANGFGGLYGTNGGYDNQVIKGNGNTFAKDHVFSQNKNVGNGLKGSFKDEYGVQSIHQGIHQGVHHGQGGYNGISSINPTVTGGQGLYTATGQSTDGHHYLNKAPVYGKFLGTTG